MSKMANLKQTEYKQKRGKALTIKTNRAIAHADCEYNPRIRESVKERFYRPAYGKIGERGECYGDR